MYKKHIKRLLDILLSLIGLPFFCVIFFIIAPIIFLFDRGPIFYNADRIGYKGKKYKMFKFRSMKVNAPDIRNADGSTFNSEDDPRVTKIGKFLRKTSLDHHDIIRQTTETPVNTGLCGLVQFISDGGRDHYFLKTQTAGAA